MAHINFNFLQTARCVVVPLLCECIRLVTLRASSSQTNQRTLYLSLHTYIGEPARPSCATINLLTTHTTQAINNPSMYISHYLFFFLFLTVMFPL